MPEKSVFFDPTGNRSRSLSRLAWLFAVLTTIIVFAFVTTILSVQSLTPLIIAGDKKLHAIPFEKAQQAHSLKKVSELAKRVKTHQRGVPRSSHPDTMPIAPADTHISANIPAANKPLAIGFYVNWDDSSYPSLKRMLPQLDWVVPSWINSQKPNLTPQFDIDRRALDLIRRTKPQTSILPMWQNASDGEWDGASLATLVADPDLRAQRLVQIEKLLLDNQLQGLVIDFENVPRAAHKNYLTFLSEIKLRFAAHHWTLAIAAPFDDPEWDYQAYAAVTDYIMLMAYDEHWEEGSPGSIASQDWFTKTLQRRMQKLDPQHTIICIGSYGYDWSQGKTADDITFQEAVLTARESEATIEFDPVTLNPRYSYEENDGSAHQVWLLDGVTAFNQIHIADAYRPAGYALWRLGSEDPSISSVFGQPYGAAAPVALRQIAMGSDIDMEGSGEILRIAAQPSPGSRNFSVDAASGLITAQNFVELPSSYVIRRLGALPGKIALTFDDGPDAIWTPKILDILKQKNVHASFFIIGENGQANPNLVQRMFDEGHDVGNHTFTHPNLGESPRELTEIELNATQRLFEAITGHSMRFFRPPYFGDAEPTTADELIPVERAQHMGYITVGLRVDPDDWQRPPAATIVQRTLEQIGDPNPEIRGQIVLLHDAGGDRQQTVAALPVLIDTLRAKGYELVPVSQLAGLTHEQAMPVVKQQRVSQIADRIVFYLTGWANHALYWLFMLAISLGLLRLFILCGLGSWQRWHQRRSDTFAITDNELVSVLIPAFNESKVIATSIARILQSNHSNLEVIVIDDGSTDNTSAVVRERFGGDARVHLLTLSNSGKARAINAGLTIAKGSVIVALDADTQFEPDCIAKLVRWFADPRVGAVAGNAKVGNRINTVTRWQALEYITAQNLERRALAAIDSITVVPGAVGAWRRSVLDQVGGFPVHTLAEDQDLTLRIQTAGYRVIYDDQAIAWTEAPETFAGLAKQRFRWSFGTLQCLWKYRSVVLRPRYGMLGMIALPQVWLFQIIFGLISPLVDLALLWQIISTGIDYLQHKQQADTTNLVITSTYYALFTLVDVSAAALAFALEKKEDWKLLWWLIQQRFGYRQIMYYVIVKSVVRALHGSHVGWGKLDRTASVNKN
jgi:cellulose synthase/poly-beta-1,6-N-acetylglucosamine synthase-like glycosyltransferase/peptidoglycan/xylan/chitin deacetylase (PgdA/CDA1 family)/spore germination protein YaaH